jgi:hypothetical protein
MKNLLDLRFSQGGNEEYYLLGCNTCSLAEVYRSFRGMYCLFKFKSKPSKIESVPCLLTAGLAYCLTLKIMLEMSLLLDYSM